MANMWARDRAGRFYLGIGLLSLAAIAVGFSTTYVAPMRAGTFGAPLVVHLHGALALGWVLLFIGQSLLVRGKRTPLHRKLGIIGLPLAVGVFVTGVGTALWATERDLPKLGNFASTNLLGTVTSLSLFVAFVTGAIVLRRRPDWHKRLMLLATVVVLWPAYFRFRHLMPFVPRPEIWLALILADLPLLVAALRDRLVYGRVHTAYAVFGAALVVEQALEVLLFTTPLWTRLGVALYAPFR